MIRNRSIWRNNKSGAAYVIFCGQAKDATNSRLDTAVVVYGPLGSSEIFVRDRAEFLNKFTEEV